MLDKKYNSILRKTMGTTDFKNEIYSFRLNGDSEIIDNEKVIIKKIDNGLDITIKNTGKEELFYLPVIINKGGYDETVYNKIVVEQGAKAKIIAGCAICHSDDKKSSHQGIHEIIIKENASLDYSEKHYADNEKVLNELSPNTTITAEENTIVNLHLSQLGGVRKSDRHTTITAYENAKINVNERLLTEGEDESKSTITVYLKEDGASADILSRSVASGNSKQKTKFYIVAEANVNGHIECDGIVMEQGEIEAIPMLNAKSSEAALIHEAAIGKIANNQILKLMSLGLTEVEATNEIIKGFLN